MPHNIIMPDTIFTVPHNVLSKSNTYMCLHVHQMRFIWFNGDWTFCNQHFRIVDSFECEFTQPDISQLDLRGSECISSSGIFVYTGVHNSAKNIQIWNHIQYSQCPTTPLCPSSFFQRLKKYTHMHPQKMHERRRGYLELFMNHKGKTCEHLYRLQLYEKWKGNSCAKLYCFVKAYIKTLFSCKHRCSWPKSTISHCQIVIISNVRTWTTHDSGSNGS